MTLTGTSGADQEERPRLAHEAVPTPAGAVSVGVTHDPEVRPLDDRFRARKTCAQLPVTPPVRRHARVGDARLG